MTYCHFFDNAEIADNGDVSDKAEFADIAWIDKIASR